MTRSRSDSTRPDDRGNLPSLSALLVASQEWVKNTVTKTVSDSKDPQSQKIGENRRKSDHSVSQGRPWLLERKSDPSRKSSRCDSIGTGEQIEVQYVFKTRRGSPMVTDPPPTKFTTLSHFFPFSNAKFDTSHVTRDTWHMTCDMTGGGSSLALPVWEWRCLEDISTKDDWLKSRFILPLQSGDQVKLYKFNINFSNNFFVSCPKLLKTTSLSVFFKEGLMLYVFESLKWKGKT